MRPDLQDPIRLGAEFFLITGESRPDAVSIPRLRKSEPALFAGRGTAIEGGLIAHAIAAAAALCVQVHARLWKPGLGWKTKLDGIGESSGGGRWMVIGGAKRPSLHNQGGSRNRNRLASRGQALRYGNHQYSPEPAA